MRERVGLGGQHLGLEVELLEWEEVDAGGVEVELAEGEEVALREQEEVELRQ